MLFVAVILRFWKDMARHLAQCFWDSAVQIGAMGVVQLDTIAGSVANQAAVSQDHGEGMEG